MSNLSQAALSQTSAKSTATVESLINDFNSEDGAARERARRAVVRIGPPAVAALVNILGRAGARAGR